MSVGTYVRNRERVPGIVLLTAVMTEKKHIYILAMGM